MKKLIILLPMLLSGCSVEPPSFEPENINDIFALKLAEVSMPMLKQYYPPAKTAFNISDEDLKLIFTNLLVEELRANGYAINKDGIPLRYIVDEIDKQHYRLTLLTPKWEGNIVVRKYKNKLLAGKISQIVKN